MTTGLDEAARLLGVDPTPTLDQRAAVARILDAVRARGLAAPTLSLSSRPLRPGQLFDAAGMSIDFPRADDPRYRRCVVALVDPEPRAKWAHPAWLAFLPANGDGDVVLVPTELPPHDEGPVRFVPVAP